MPISWGSFCIKPLLEVEIANSLHAASGKVGWGEERIRHFRSRFEIANLLHAVSSKAGQGEECNRRCKHGRLVSYFCSTNSALRWEMMFFQNIECVCTLGLRNFSTTSQFKPISFFCQWEKVGKSAKKWDVSKLAIASSKICQASWNTAQEIPNGKYENLNPRWSWFLWKMSDSSFEQYSARNLPTFPARWFWSDWFVSNQTRLASLQSSSPLRQMI